jgi:hypothetical protein
MSQPQQPQQPPYPPQQPYGGYAAPRPHHPSAVPALVLGILSLVLCGFFTGIPAMVMGRRAVREIRGGAQYGGEGMAQAGFWTGLIGTALTALAALLVLGVFAFGGVVSGSFQQTCSTVGSDGTSAPC